MPSIGAKVSEVAGLALLLLGLPVVGFGATIKVFPGQSIQSAVDRAAAGDTVLVHAGVYHEAGTAYCAPWVPGFPSACGNARTAAVLITKPLTLQASGSVQILGSGPSGLTDGVVALGPGPNPANPRQSPNISGVEIKGFTLDNFAHNGIVLGYVSDFNIEGNQVSNMQEVGIWPMLSANGQVKKNIAYGTKDSALWVEGSQNIRVIDNDLSAAPTGLEVTISSDIVMDHNKVHDNTTGIGLYHPAGAGLPQAYWPQFAYGNWVSVENYIHDNNMLNPVGGGYTGQIPPGIGMLVLGVQNVGILTNRIENNNFVGVGVMDWCIGQILAAGAAGVPLTYQQCVASLPTGFQDSTVNHVRVAKNQFAGNGAAPSIPGLPGADILYVGADAYGGPAGTGDCQSDNKVIGSVNTPPMIVAQPATGLTTCRK